MLVFDAGNFAGSSRSIKNGQLPMVQRKAELVLDGLKMSKLDAVGVGERDLALGVDWLWQNLQERSIPAILTNVDCFNYPFNKGMLFEIEGVRLGVYSLISSGDSIDGCNIIDIQEAFESNRLDADIHMVFASLTENEMQLLSDKVDIFIESKVGKMNALPESLDDDTVWIAAGHKSKHLGQVTLSYTSGLKGFRNTALFEGIDADIQRRLKRKEVLQAELEKSEPDSIDAKKNQRQLDYIQQALDDLQSKKDRFANAPPANNIQQELIALDRSIADFEALTPLIEEAKVEIEKLESQAKDREYHGPYVGSQVCLSCHPSQSAHWLETPHAQAWNTLVKVNREMDSQCFTCHVTGAHAENGPKTAMQASLKLQNVGCESCHGAGQSHVRNPQKSLISKEVPDAVCIQCHDGVQDDNQFNPTEYRAKVVH